MNQELKTMAFFCCIHVVDLRYLVKGHELGAGKDINWKLDIVMDDLPYNVRKNQKEDKLECAVIFLKSMNDIEKILGLVMRIAAHGYVFSSSL